MKNLPLTPDQFLTACSPPEQVAAIKAMITRHNQRREAEALLFKQQRENAEKRGYWRMSRKPTPGAFGHEPLRMLAARKESRNAS